MRAVKRGSGLTAIELSIQAKWLIFSVPFSSLDGHSINAHSIRNQFPFYIISDKNDHASKSGSRLVIVFQ